MNFDVMDCIQWIVGLQNADTRNIYSAILLLLEY